MIENVLASGGEDVRAQLRFFVSQILRSVFMSRDSAIFKQIQRGFRSNKNFFSRPRRAIIGRIRRCGDFATPAANVP
jgi:hypothetical protein